MVMALLICPFRNVIACLYTCCVWYFSSHMEAYDEQASSVVSRSHTNKELKANYIKYKKVERLELHERLEQEDLVKIHNAFLAEENGLMNKKKLENILYHIAKLSYDEEEFNLLFMRINTKRYVY